MILPTQQTPHNYENTIATDEEFATVFSSLDDVPLVAPDSKQNADRSTNLDHKLLHQSRPNYIMNRYGFASSSGIKL